MDKGAYQLMLRHLVRKRLVGIWEGPEVSRDSPTGAAEQVGIHSIDASLFVVSAHIGTATAVIDFAG